jgi:hypothetical protein
MLGAELLPAASLAVEVTKRINSSTSALLLFPSSLEIIQQASMQPVAFQQIAARREHPFPESNSIPTPIATQTPTQLSLKNQEYVLYDTVSASLLA